MLDLSICSDLDSTSIVEKGGGGGGGKIIVAACKNTEDSIKNGSGSGACLLQNMSVCFEASNVLANQVGTSSAPTRLPDEIATTNPPPTNNNVSAAVVQPPITSNVIQSSINHVAVQPTGLDKPEPITATKSIAKLVVANHPSANSCNPVLQKVVNPPLITVLNPSGPLTVVKTLCVTSGVSSTPQFTLVNSAPLNVSNAVGKSPTITLLNAPVTVVKAITTQQGVEKQTDMVANSVGIINNASPVIENRGHNVFVKNTCPDSTVPDMPQSHKLLTANAFPQANVLASINTSAKAVNGQRSKLKILSNVMMPGTSQPPNNLLLNKNQRYLPRQKIIGPNGATTKYINKPPPNNVVKTPMNSNMKLQDKSPTRVAYPTHKSQIKTMPPMNNFVQKPQQGIKTLSPQHKSIPGQVQRTGSGLRTIPPQRPQKIANKPNYIGKHAVQAQKTRQTHGKMKGVKMPPTAPYNVHGPQMPDKQLTELTFNQALTAQIIETLSNTSTPLPYEILPTRYQSAFSCPDTKQPVEPTKQAEDKSKSGLDALSLICQAVLLDHNYNATLPPDSPTRPTPPSIVPSQINGISTNSMYSPGAGKRRSLPSSNTISSTSSLSNLSVTASNSNSIRTPQDDDASSDISDGSERKHDTEGEETDTAPEAEAVNNDDHYDGYGDYVTRCICGFLHDDGYMVECDRCKVWQHVQCVVKNKQIPEEYLCEVCDPAKPIDRQRARTVQQQWLRDRQFADPKLRKDNAKAKEVFKPKETISDSDTSDGEHVAHNNNVVAKGRALTNRRKSDNPQPKQTLARQRRDTTKEIPHKKQKRKERKIVRRKTTKTPAKSHSDDENQDTWSTHLPQLRQWIEKYEEAVTNHYSPELRARISNIRVNSGHSDLNVQFDPTVCKCRVHTQPLTEIRYLVSTVHLSPNTPVVELRGKYMLSTQHRNSGGSLTTRQHSQRPGPFLFFYRLHKDNTEVCVDTRTYGNSARFIRRSCKPNAELRHCIEKGVLHLYIVSIATVDKNSELTIKHESHDLAAIGTTQIACACGNMELCAVNKSTIKKSGDVAEMQRKRRGRRTVSSSLPEVEPPKEVKEEPPPPPAPLPPPPVKLPSPVKHEKVEETVKREPVEIKMEIKEEPLEEPVNVVEEIKEEKKNVKEELMEPMEEKIQTQTEIKKEKEEEAKSSSDEVVTGKRRSSKSDKEEDKPADAKEEKTKCKKLSREERKLEAILRAIEQMEKAESRKQEHQAKQAHRRESEPGPNPKEEDKQEPKLKRRRRKGRARTTSQSARRNRLNSTDSYMTSGDENMLSPNDGNQPANQPSLKDLSSEPADNRAVGLLLALSNGENTNKHEKSPARELDSNSNSTHSSPETPLSSACLLVQAAVEPLEQGFKFPKTKKGMMNEWLNKVPEPIHSASSISPSSLTPHLSNSSEYEANTGFYSPAKNLSTLAQAVNYCDSSVQSCGNAKKRWLRQAISEDHSCDSPTSRPDSPPISDMVAPPKKRRLPRESISSETSPPTTPTSCVPPMSINKLKKDNRPNQEGCVEIVYSGTDGDSPTQTLESDAVLKERAAKMKQEFSIVPSSSEGTPHNELGHLGGCLMDPRLTRDSHMFSNNDLVGTVEKTLSILGFEENKPETMLPKRKVKLSITEYRQRKKQNVNDKGEEQEPEQMSTEENNSSESFKVISRMRSGSTSSSTSLTSSDDEIAPELPVKVPAFNSEPTELERQREISSMRLKKAFGLAVDEEPRPALNVEAILNLELEPKVKPIPIPSPTFPIPGSCEVTKEASSPKPPLSPERSVSPQAISRDKSPTPPVDVDVEMEEPEPEAENQTSALMAPPETEGNKDEDMEPNLFYTPDEEEAMQTERVFEATNTSSSVSYVPPFNNPVYPNSSFTNYTSTIDDDARYEGRNPSPPPDLDSASFDSQS